METPMRAPSPEEYLQAKFVQNTSSKVPIERVSVHGLHRTRPFLLRNHLSSIFGSALDSSRTPIAVMDMLNRCIVAQKILMDTGMFQRVSFVPSPGVDGGIVLGVDVVEQKSPLFVSTDVGVGSHGFGSDQLVRFGFANYFGLLERIEGKVGYLSSENFNIGVHGVLPFVNGPYSSVHVDVFARKDTFAKESGFDSLNYGVNARYLHENHTFGIGSTIRDVIPVPDAPGSVRREAGLRSKNSVTYRYFYDTRDSPLRPWTGYSFRAFTEFAGLGGSSRFGKHEIGGAYHHAVSDALSLGISANFGIMYSLFGSKLAIEDKFFLGSGLMHGFEPRGVGILDRGYALGGNTMGSVNLSASFPLSHPTLEKYDVRGHVFLSVGNLGNVEVGDLYSPDYLLDTINLFGRNSRVAAGVGVLLGSFQLNFSTALRSLRGDKPATWQIGVNYTFDD